MPGLVVTLFSSEAGKFAGDGKTEEAREMAPSIDSLRRGRVIPDVIDPFTPSADLKVKYGHKKVKDGAEFTPSEAKSSPAVEISPKSKHSNGRYILVWPLPFTVECDSEKQAVSSCHRIVSELWFKASGDNFVADICLHVVAFFVCAIAPTCTHSQAPLLLVDTLLVLIFFRVCLIAE